MNRASILAIVGNTTQEQGSMAGMIISVDDYGSVVVVRLDAEGGQRIIPMDRRAFGWMVEGEGIENVDDLIGRPVRFDGETLVFLDALEVA